jgi:molybdopterin synthase catalytic subunit
MEQVLLTREPLDQAAVVAQVTTPEHGAVVTFEGIVRNHSRGSSVSHLEYEAYEPLALAQLLRIVAEAQERWTARCAIAHRLGKVDAGDCSVVVAVSSPHRGDAFEACRWLMESLKSTTPIWKKEFASGGAQWIEGSDAIASSG